MKLYFRILQYAKPYTSRILALLLCLIVTSATTALGMYFIKPVLDKIFNNSNQTQAMFYLRLLPIAIVLTYLVKGLAAYGQEYFVNYLGNGIVRDIRNQVYRHLLGQELAFFHSQKSGLLISRITHDSTLMQAAVSNVLGQLLGSGLTIAGLIGLLFYLDWKLAIITLFVFPVAVYPIVSIGRSLRRISRDSQAKMADVTSVLHETIGGIRIVKAFGMQAQEERRFSGELQHFFNLSMRALRKAAITSPLMELIGSLGICFMVVWSGTRVIQGVYTAGTFFAFLGGLGALYPQVKNLANINNIIQQALAAGQRVFELLDRKPQVHDAPGAQMAAPLREGIEFCQVDFFYQPDRLVLENINLRVRAGECLALVGRSGAGKTTLVDLIPRFADPVRGGIRLDGQDIRQLSLASLRSQIGLVTQETFLFNDTIRNNIAYARPGATAAEVEAAAQAAHAHEFILAAPHGYDTLIGERGVRLSGGQRQRLAIARAILKNPPILILDEATSALDTESERLIQDALETLMQHRTTFVIAHRLSTVQHADQIVVLEQGQVVEQGKHAALMQAGGAYARLVQMQFGRKGEKMKGGAGA